MDIQLIFRCAIGMDIHLAIIHVCVILQEPGCEPAVYRRQFGAFQRDQRAMAEWIAGFAPHTVVMESTGSDFQSPYGRSGEGRYPGTGGQCPTRQEGARPQDRYHRRGMAGDVDTRRVAAGQFHPTGETAQLAPNKPLPSPNHGHVGGGEKPPGAPFERCQHPHHGGRLRRPWGSGPHDDRLSARRWHAGQALRYAGRLKAPREELLGSLQGDLSEEHLFVARMIRQHIDTLQTQLADLEHRLFDELKPYEAAVQLLLTLPGIDRLSAAKLLVEIGVDMTAFGTADRLSKWAGLCPGNHEAAGNGKEDLVQDFVNIASSFCARLYGQRRSKRKMERIIAELQSCEEGDHPAETEPGQSW
jgi:transposase